MTRRIRVSQRAGGQIREASTWWCQHRNKAPLAFADDLEDALHLIADLPGIGEPTDHPSLPSARRVLLARTRYYLYYSDDVGTQSVDILALWHVSRGGVPDL